MIALFQSFVKLTGWLPAWLCFRTKISYEDRAAQGRRVRGAAILVSNHTSVFDYAVTLFVFPFRTLRVQMAEVLFKKKILGLFLRCMGGIRVDRGAHDFGFLRRSLDVLEKGGVVGIYPEGRLPKKGEARPLPFGAGAAYLALNMPDVPVICLHTDGSYFSLRRRAHVKIGTPLYGRDLADPKACEKENLERATRAIREKVIRLGE
jgi:1-acyl-sn-glycerol-3-phosphate acyltransferase